MRNVISEHIEQLAPAPFSFTEQAVFNSDHVALVPDQYTKEGRATVLRAYEIIDHQAILDRKNQEAGLDAEESKKQMVMHPQDDREPWRPTEEDALKRIKATQQHHDKLRELGMNILAVQYAIVQDHKRVPDQLFIFSTTDVIKGTNIDYIDPWPTDMVASQVVKPLLDYYEWVITTGQPHFLYDLSADKSFVSLPREEQFTMLEDGSTIVLHDLAPNVKSPDASPNDFQRYLDSAGRLIGVLRVHGHDNEACNDLVMQQVAIENAFLARLEQKID